MIETEGTVIELAAKSQTHAEDVRRCLAVLYASNTGEQALDRDFGIDADCLNKPLETAKALLTAEIIRKTAKYEPRARVLRVEWQQSDANQGILRPKVVVELV